MLDLTKPVQTKCGNPVRILCTDLKNTEKPVAVAITLDGDYEYVSSCRKDGTGAWTLVNVPVKTSNWTPIWGNCTSASSFARLDIAIDHGKAGEFVSSPFMGVLRRDYEDGVCVSAEFEPVQ